MQKNTCGYMGMAQKILFLKRAQGTLGNKIFLNLTDLTKSTDLTKIADALL